MVVVEVCVEGADAAVAAAAGGADRVELCANGSLGVGGLTPEARDIEAACRRLTVPVHVLIRPRAGDFFYDDEEFGRMGRDIDLARRLGAGGVVLGVNRPDATIDVERLTTLVAQARPLVVTFHKAFDELKDPFHALDELARLGVERVLTSGQAPSAREGLTLLRVLTRRAGSRVAVMAGGRVRASDLPGLLGVGLREIHVASAVTVDGATDAGAVRQFVAEVRRVESQTSGAG